VRRSGNQSEIWKTKVVFALSVLTGREARNLSPSDRAKKVSGSLEAAMSKFRCLIVLAAGFAMLAGVPSGS